MAAVTMAVLRFWPFNPPGLEVRTGAAGVEEAARELRPWLEDRLYAPLGIPEPGDWLHKSYEPSQSVRAWRRMNPNLPSGVRKRLYLLPLGEWGRSPRIPSLEALREYLGLFFGLEAVLVEAVPAAEVPLVRRINEHFQVEQWKTGEILRWLPGRLPADAYALLAVTLTDLYPQNSWNFVFGEATLRNRVGVFSLARNDPEFGSGSTGTLKPHRSIQSLMLRRACVILSHEMGHMFGWTHCRYYRCLMGGSGSLEESDRSPMGLCPVCLHKLHIAVPFAPERRHAELQQFLERHGMEADAHEAALRGQGVRPLPGND